MTPRDLMNEAVARTSLFFVGGVIGFTATLHFVHHPVWRWFAATGAGLAVGLVFAFPLEFLKAAIEGICDPLVWL